MCLLGIPLSYIGSSIFPISFIFSVQEDEDLQNKNLWKKVAELSTQKVILGILCTLVVLPFLQVEGVDYFKSFALVQCVDMYEDPRVGPQVQYGVVA